MKKGIFTILLISCLLGASCGPDPVELCDCVTTDTGEWDLYLSKECQQKMIDAFGPELDGMDEWFRDNCERTAHPQFKDEPKRPIAI